MNKNIEAIKALGPYAVKAAMDGEKIFKTGNGGAWARTPQDAIPFEAPRSAYAAEFAADAAALALLKVGESRECRHYVRYSIGYWTVTRLA